MMRILDVLFTIPLLAILVVLSKRIEGSGNWFFVALLLGFLVWFSLRPSRASRVPVVAGEGVRRGGPGARRQRRRIIFRHILPNTVGHDHRQRHADDGDGDPARDGPVVPRARHPGPGHVARIAGVDGQAASQTRPWLFYFPGVFIIIIVLCVNFVGDGLRDAFDPKQTAGAAVSERRDPEESAGPVEATTTITADEAERAPDDSGVVLAVENLSVDFPTEDGVVHAVRGVTYDAQVRRGARHRRRVGLGQVGEHAWRSWGCCRSRPTISGSVRYRGKELLGLKEKQFNEIRGRQDRHDLPGPDDVAEPGAPGGPPDRRGGAVAPRTSAKNAARRAGGRDARPGRHPQRQGCGPGCTRTSSRAGCASGP